MGSSLRLLAVLLAAVVVTAAVTPCPPSVELAGNASAAEQSVKAKCPCSCSHAKPPGRAGGHLDFALARAEAGATQPLLVAFARAPLAPSPPAPHARPDPVPI